MSGSYRKRRQSPRAAKRPANPAGDDIAEMVEKARDVLRYAEGDDYEGQDYARATACATVAMAMMRLREYEA